MKFIEESVIHEADLDADTKKSIDVVLRNDSLLFAILHYPNLPSYVLAFAPRMNGCQLLNHNIDEEKKKTKTEEPISYVAFDNKWQYVIEKSKELVTYLNYDKKMFEKSSENEMKRYIEIFAKGLKKARKQLEHFITYEIKGSLHSKSTSLDNLLTQELLECQTRSHESSKLLSRIASLQAKNESLKSTLVEVTVLSEFRKTQLEQEFHRGIVKTSNQLEASAQTIKSLLQGSASSASKDESRTIGRRILESP